MNPLSPRSRLRRFSAVCGVVVAFASCASPNEDVASTEGHLDEVAVGSRFADVREKIYATPLATLPAHNGLDLWTVVENFVGSSDWPTQGLSVRSRRIFVDQADERREGEKWLHPRGACAEARWTIDEGSAATGLFAKGTSVPALVRLSSGDRVSEGGTAAGGRIMGMAVKLFPTTSDQQRVTTRNIIMLDKYGFERSTRNHPWVEDDGAPVYFTNVAPAKSALGKVLSTFFDRFDKPNFARPVYGVARASVGKSSDLPHAVTPYEIRFVAKAGTPLPPDTTSLDFRSEVVAEPPVSLDIVMQSLDGTHDEAQRIGSLALGRFVVSDYCDLQLRFHHDPIEDQLQKYWSYEVVKDLLGSH